MTKKPTTKADRFAAAEKALKALIAKDRREIKEELAKWHLVLERDAANCGVFWSPKQLRSMGLL